MSRNNDNSKFFQIVGSQDANGNVTGLVLSANITAGNANLGNTVTANYVGGTLTTAAQPNITSVGNLTGLTVNGTITASNANLGNTATANFFTGTLTTAAQPNITSVGNLTGLTVSGNATVAGNLTVTGNVTYVNVTNLNVQDPIISLGGGANGNALTSNDGKDRGTALDYYTTEPVTAFMGWDNSNGEFGFGSNVSIANEVVTYNSLGNVRASTVIANTLGSNVTATETANFTGASNVALGAVANVHITGGSNGQVLTTNGAGNLSWTTVSGGGGGGSNISNGNSNVSIATANGNVTVAAEGNTVITVTGTGANVTGTGNFSGNVTAGNFVGTVANGTSSMVMNSNGNILFSAGNTAANVLTLNTSGNIVLGGSGYFVGRWGCGNSTIQATSTGGNIIINAGGGVTELTVTSTGVNVTGYMNASGNLTAGNANLGNLATANYFSGTLTTADQPNVNSLGTLTGLSVSGTSNLGNISNVKVFGATTGQFIQGDDQGNLFWANAVTGPAGSNLQIQFNDLGTQFGATPELTFDYGTNTLAVTGQLTVSNTVSTGAVTVANLPNAVTSGAGARLFVTDANSTTFASVVANGGSNGVPVYSDGTDWRIG